MRNFLKLLKDTFFPMLCISCNAEGSLLCQNCLSLVNINPYPALFPRNDDLAGLFYAAGYQEPLIQRAIKAAKYPPFAKELIPSLASLIIWHFAALNNEETRTFGNLFAKDPSQYLIVPIPLSKKRLRWRGFNQAELLAAELARFFNLPLDATTLLKMYHTSPQAALKEKEREKNVENAFSVKDPSGIKDKTIFLVDDVFTTGATMRSAAKVLKQNGANRVWGVAVARG